MVLGLNLSRYSVSLKRGRYSHSLRSCIVAVWQRTCVVRDDVSHCRIDFT